jgi:hypothetical protein
MSPTIRSVMVRALLLACLAMLGAACSSRERFTIVGMWETEQATQFLGAGRREVHAMALFDGDGDVTISVFDAQRPSEEFTGTYQLTSEGLEMDIPGMRGRAWTVQVEQMRMTLETPMGEVVMLR